METTNTGPRAKAYSKALAEAAVARYESRGIAERAFGKAVADATAIARKDYDEALAIALEVHKAAVAKIKEEYGEIGY